jgi:hypothetical protein
MWLPARAPVIVSRQVHLYALNPSDGSAWRAFVEREAGPGFVDLSSHGVKDAVDRIRADGIDILVDLMGFTGGSFAINRDAIMAARPAALQLCMLGYPSTCGSDCPGPLGPFKWPSGFPQKIGLPWRVCTSAQGA